MAEVYVNLFKVMVIVVVGNLEKTLNILDIPLSI